FNRHMDAGQFEEAVQVGKRIFNYRAERQGGGHWQVIDVRLIEERWERVSKVPAKDRAEGVRVINGTTEVRQLGQRLRYRQAEAKLREALAIWQKVLGEQHPETATSYNNLAACLYAQGKHAEALRLQQKALDINLKALGEQHPATAHSYNNVA